MFPWDFDRHLDSQHSKCKVCQQYLINEEMLQDHIELEHPTVAPEPVCHDKGACTKKRGRLLQHYPHPLNLRGRGPYQFPTLLNT